MMWPGELFQFPLSGAWMDPYLLVLLGFVVGVLGGFFGVGGSFIAGPSLAFMGLPMNYVVGTDLCHIAGKSVVAAKKHRALGNVDVKLGLLMTLGTVIGVEAGVMLIEYLKKLGLVDKVVSYVFLVILCSVSAFMLLEGLLTLRRERRQQEGGAMEGLARRVQAFRFGPMISLPESGIPQISLFVVLFVSFIGGFCGGFLGGGAGYIRMPLMVFVLGIPTHIAVGTDLFEIVISAGWGTFSHALRGNVDVMIALVMQTGAAIGAQIGAQMTQHIRGTWIRLAFVPLPLIGAALLIAKLMRGGGGH